MGPRGQAHRACLSRHPQTGRRHHGGGALSNLPEDARGRLQTMLVLAEETAAQSGFGQMVVVDTGLGTAEYHLLESGEESASHRRSTGGPSSRRSRSAFCSVGTLDDVLPVSSRPALSTLSRDTANAQVDTAAATQEPSSSTQSPPRLRQPLLRCSLHQDSRQPRHPQSCRRLP